MHVLLVEDNSTIRASLTRLLLEEGYAVTTASTAEEAYGIYDDSMQVALLDLRLPGVWGDVLAQGLRKLNPSVQVIFLTAEQPFPHCLEQMVPGSHVLAKPTNFPVLLALLRKREDFQGM